MNNGSSLQQLFAFAECAHAFTAGFLHTNTRGVFDFWSLDIIVKLAPLWGERDKRKTGKKDKKGERMYGESRLHKSFTSHAWLCDCKMPKRRRDGGGSESGGGGGGEVNWRKLSGGEEGFEGEGWVKAREHERARKREADERFIKKGSEDDVESTWSMLLSF